MYKHAASGVIGNTDAGLGKAQPRECGTWVLLAFRRHIRMADHIEGVDGVPFDDVLRQGYHPQVLLLGKWLPG